MPQCFGLEVEVSVSLRGTSLNPAALARVLPYSLPAGGSPSWRQQQHVGAPAGSILTGTTAMSIPKAAAAAASSLVIGVRIIVLRVLAVVLLAVPKHSHHSDMIKDMKHSPTIEQQQQHQGPRTVHYTIN